MVPRAARFLGWYAAIGGLLSLIGWPLDLRRLTDWINSGISIQPNTALATACGGLAIILASRGHRRILAILAAIVGLVGAATLLEYILNVSFGIDSPLMFGRPWGRGATVAPGRMGIPASTSFTLLGIGFTLAVRGGWWRRVAPIAGLLVAAIAAMSLIGHLFNASELYSNARLTAIAFQTSTFLFALGLGLVLIVPEHQPTLLLRDEGAGGALVRQILPFIVTIPIVLGMLRLRGEAIGLYTTNLGTALLVSALLFLLIALLWWGGVTVHAREIRQRRAEDALRVADRRKDEFLATLAHELRNPLAPIRNALRLLRARPDAPVLDMLDRQVGHMVRLVDELVEVSRISRGDIQLRKEPVPLASVVQAAVETHQPLIAAATQVITTSLPEQPLTLEGDPVRLSQVVGNLLHNASKFSPAGGHITIAARREGAMARISVRDDGAGIAPELLPRVFDMFTRGPEKNAGPGLGIGLALVRSLVQLHGGFVQVSSGGPGKGSEFVVSLPLARGPAVPAALATPSPRLSQRVLIVDDNRDGADSLAAVLRLAGAETRVAYSGPDALAELPRFQPTVALLDIGMPDMDGYDLAGRLRVARPDLPLIALTGWGQIEDRQRSREAGFRLHLTKPVDPEALIAVLDSLAPQKSVAT
jgi:signal transduction histidine kinase/ActR/RegA family two-component response regulator